MEIGHPGRPVVNGPSNALASASHLAARLRADLDTRDVTSDARWPGNPRAAVNRPGDGLVGRKRYGNRKVRLLAPAQAAPKLDSYWEGGGRGRRGGRRPRTHRPFARRARCNRCSWTVGAGHEAGCHGVQGSEVSWTGLAQLTARDSQMQTAARLRLARRHHSCGQEQTHSDREPRPTSSRQGGHPNPGPQQRRSRRGRGADRHRPFSTGILIHI
jgi:hypothetical protein